MNFVTASDKEVYAWLRGQEYQGVEGIYVHGNDDAELRFGVVIGSHAKEVPSGIALLRLWMKLLNDNRVNENAQFYLAIGNLPGTDLFYATEDPVERKKLRFTPGGRDMNRLPSSPEALLKGTLPEERRASDLRRVLQPRELLYLFDLHSTDQPSKPAGLAIAGSLEATRKLFERMPLPEVLLNVVKVQATFGTKTTTLGGVLGAENSVEIESGQTGSVEANAAASQCFEAWGVEIGLLNERFPIQQQEVYEVVNSVMAPSTAYKVVDSRLLAQHAQVRVGEVLLRNEMGDEIKSPCNGLLIWGPDDVQLTETDVASEIWYIVRQLN